ncbi:MAG: asparagine synthase (glutamine-hydrolyzing) [Firmicutes bacterium]|nr:asparagine synthase (glutamine-hydrolyzing) [Bacillota bacterium]
MCGITGWIDWDQDLTQQRTVLQAMVDRLAPRGPDAEGSWLSPHAALGHRRLIVVDPAGGGQPMVRQRGDATYVLVYNGELYNTEDLRQELLARGHTFQGHSDTEVLLAAYMEWGPECVPRLNGIFAFGVWDTQKQTLFLARDRLGVKPLFYAIRRRGLLFASELKALLVHPAVPPEVDAEGLAEVLALGPARTPGHGVFRGVQELRPGHWLLYSRSGARVHRYWALMSHPHPDDLDTTARRVRELLEDTVERQLVADVPLCSLLSGGLDSSAVTAFAAAVYRRRGLGPLPTYSVDYADNDRYFHANFYQPDSDGPWVQRMVGLLGTRHESVVIDTPELVEALKAALHARDLPGMADVDSSLLLFSRQIRKGATVGLSGEAADEVFGGYPWFRDPGMIHNPPGTFPWSRMTAQRMALLRPEVRQHIHGEEYVAARYQEALDEVPRLPGEAPEEARMRELLYLSISRFLPTLLDRKDRMSMAVGLEVRVPYCDHRLVEYVWNIPWPMKFAGGREKGILRRALRGVLPDEVLERRKSPYPKTHHPAYLAATRRWLEEILADPGAPLLQLMDEQALREQIRTNGAAFEPSWFGQLMGGAQLFAYLAQLDQWLREYRVVLR